MPYASGRRLKSTAFAFAALLPICALLGATLALGSNQLTALAIGGVFGLLLLFIPASYILTLLLVLSFAGAGLATYYLKISQAPWLPYALCLFMWLKLLVDRLAWRKSTSLAPVTPAFILALYVFFITALAATLINGTPLFSALVGAKNFIFVWSVTFLVASGAVDERYLRNAWIGVLLLAVLQTPFAIAQHFMEYRVTGNWDAVVGTFGGDPEGGGSSGSMAIFLILAIGAAVALLRVRCIPVWFGTLVIAAAGCAVMMAEIKVVFFLLPVMLALVLVRDLTRRPLFALGAVGLAVVLLAGIGTYYRTVYYGDVSAARRADLRSYVDYVLRVDTTPDFVNRRTGEVSRLGAPLLWGRWAGEYGADKTLVGYGMTASRTSRTIGVGAAQKHHSFRLTTSGLTVLLWETGLIGASSFLLMLLLAAAAAWRLDANPAVPTFHRAALQASAASLVVVLLSSAYNSSLVDGPSLQVFIAFVVGYVLFWYRRSPRIAAEARAAGG